MGSCWVEALEKFRGDVRRLVQWRVWDGLNVPVAAIDNNQLRSRVTD
jgi:hypothetical protein